MISYFTKLLRKELTYESSYWFTRIVFIRGLGFIYICVFLPILFQYQGLIGDNGLLPVKDYLSGGSEYLSFSLFWKHPTLFWFNQSDVYALSLAFLGLVLAIFLILGFANSIILSVLWLLQLSFVHVGQTFWSFGWETNLLELGFLSIFFVPFWGLSLDNHKVPPSKIIIYLYMWVLFRLMFGAGMIKIRYDSCWRDLSCLNYHYLTQPIPNPLSPFFHNMPEWFSKLSVLFNHICELVVPWFLFLPQVFCSFAGWVFLFFQVSIAITGNYAWINALTIVMIIPCFDDRVLKRLFSLQKRINLVLLNRAREYRFSRVLTLALLSGLVASLSVEPIKNLLSEHQAMNRSYDQFHLVNSYGVFGSVTKKRYELIFFGTSNENIGPNTKWLEYEFPCKPGKVYRRPCVASPYHYRITWQLWFAAMGRAQFNPWTVTLANKILHGESKALSLLSFNPFLENPPRYIKVDLYEYEFEKIGSTNWYSRNFVRPYISPIKGD